MSRDYFAVFVRLFRVPKFKRLTPSAQLTLFHLWGLAADEVPEATWRDIDALREVVEVNGRPSDDVDTLLAAGWLDLLDDGTVGVHDWDDHQQAASKSIRDDFEAHRKREWRRKNKSRSPQTPREETRERREEKSPDVSGRVRTQAPASASGAPGRVSPPAGYQQPTGTFSELMSAFGAKKPPHA